MGVPHKLIELLDEGEALLVRFWLEQALNGGVPPEPLLMSGPGAEELGRAVVVARVHAGEDAMVAPMSWWRELPDALPRASVVIPGLEDIAYDHLEAMSALCGLIVAGDAIPILERANLVMVDLPESRVTDLQQRRRPRVSGSSLGRLTRRASRLARDFPVPRCVTGRQTGCRRRAGEGARTKLGVRCGVELAAPVFTVCSRYGVKQREIARANVKQRKRCLHPAIG